jgi:hypothetical protein
MASFITEQKFYETNIIDPSIKVFSLSDIHGDIQSFIIALRDCAKVIRKKLKPVTSKPTFADETEERIFNLNNYTDFNKDTYDENMESILNLDLNKDEHIYINDLNYEWCGGNTHVVICGDIIDPFRDDKHHKNCIKTGGLACSYYPQIELKILMFINAINIQASLTGGKIVKLLGNHEACNIITNPNFNYNIAYSYKEDQNKGYYKGISRTDTFQVGQPGFNLLFEGGCGVLIKINNTIFVHGDLVESYDIYDDLNQFINNPQERNQKNWDDKFCLVIMVESSPLFETLFGRDRGDRKIIDKIISQKNIGNDKLEKEFCDKLIGSFMKFKSNGKIITEDANELKLVIGHCPQSWSSTYTLTANETYSELINQDDVMQVFGNDIYSGKSVFDRKDNRRRIFGISTQCLIPNTRLNRIYRVDIASSRGLDYYGEPSPTVASPTIASPSSTFAFLLANPGSTLANAGLTFANQKKPFTASNSTLKLPSSIEEENRFLYSKTPQVLEINVDGSINIIKSKMRNTRVHLPRDVYEQHAKTIPELDIQTNPIQDHYLKKYLKYKNKYLQLKQNNK